MANTPPHTHTYLAVLGIFHCGSWTRGLSRCGVQAQKLHCTSLVALRPVRSQFPNQGLNRHPLRCKADSLHHSTTSEVPRYHCLVTNAVPHGEGHQSGPLNAQLTPAPSITGSLGKSVPHGERNSPPQGGLGLDLKDQTTNINSQMADSPGKLFRNLFQSRRRICQYREQGDHLM